MSSFIDFSIDIIHSNSFPQDFDRKHTDEIMVPVSRMTKFDGYDELIYPKSNNIDQHQEIMLAYLTNIKQIRNELSQILKKIAIDNTVIVSTVNQGQSELLMNFICSSRSRGFDLGNLLVFPTDVFSKNLAEGMGVSTYYSEQVRFACCYLKCSNIIIFDTIPSLLPTCLHCFLAHGPHSNTGGSEVW